MTAELIVETERLIVRPLGERDIATLVTLWTDPQVTQFLGGPREATKLTASFLEDLAAEPRPSLDLWPVEEKSSGRVIGHCGLIPKEVDGRAEVEIIYILAASAWGRGYATEVSHAIRDHGFHALDCPRLIALIDPEHAASERVALKLGMQLESETIRPSGKRLRVYAMSR